MDMSIQLEGLTLATACEGRLEELFSECLSELMQVIEEADRYCESPPGVIKSKVSLELVIHHRISNDGTPGTTHLEASCQVKKPKLKGDSQTLYRRGGVFAAEQFEPKQVDFTKTTQPTPLRDAGADS